MRTIINDQTYEQDLAHAVDVIFEMATYIKDWDWQTLAQEAKLSTATVYRLGGRVTRLPRWQTFWKLARAVGLRVAFVDAKGREITRESVRQSAGAAHKPKSRALVAA